MSRTPTSLALAVLLLLTGWAGQTLAQNPAAEAKPAEPPAAPEAKPAALTEKDLGDLKSGIADGKVKGDTAWMLVSSAFVMLMLPGLALFYGGMVRRKNVLATMMQSMAALAVVGLYWVAFGYGLAFGPSKIMAPAFLGEGGLVGWSWDLFFLKGVAVDALLPAYNIPVYTHVLFQGMFAIITPALISGAMAERIRFWPFCIFMVLWVTLVYCPLAHMVWAFDWFDESVVPAKRGASAIGLLGKMGALDFAGGTVVHIAAGMAGLAGTIVLRRRAGYPQQTIHPNSMVLTLLGAGLLWFGWFGFNGGSATGSGALASSAFAATQAAAAAAGLAWMVVEWLHRGKPTALGLASGIVAGLVAVTPASGYVYIWGGVFIGLAAGVICYLAVCLKGVFGYDDSLDAFGVHGVGGFVGAVLTGVFCYAAVQSASADGFMAVSRLATNTAHAKAQLPDLEKAAADAKTALAAAEAKMTAEQKAAAEPPKAVADAREVVAWREGEVEAKKKEVETLEAKAATYANDPEKKRGPFTQLYIQTKAAVFASVFAFGLSFGLLVLTQVLTLGNLTTDPESETLGLDRTEHGEVGFDFGFATETSPTLGVSEPRPATAPPDGKNRFHVVVEGVDPAHLMQIWTDSCQPGRGGMEPDFRAVYPYVTTVSGNRFRFRGGDPATMSLQLQGFFQRRMQNPGIRARAEV